MGAPGENLSATDEERAWARVLDMSDLHASALLFVMAKYLAINDNPETARYAQISVNELLEYRDYTRSEKKRDFKNSLTIAERDRILALWRIWVTVPTGRRNSKRLTKQSSQLVVVTVDSESPKLISPATTMRVVRSVSRWMSKCAGTLRQAKAFPVSGSVAQIMRA